MSTKENDASSQPSGTKRRRVDDELHPDSDIWLSDGSVILTAKDHAGVTWGLKCHKSILSLSSKVFESMFTLDRPADAETYDGLPVVALPDRFSDLKELLQMIYYPVDYMPKVAAEICPEDWQEELGAISGSLRLSTKYELDNLHAHLAKILEAHWPTTLEEMDVVTERILASDDLDEFYVDMISVLLLAEEADVASVLPAVYYDVHRSWRNPRHLVRAALKEDFEGSRLSGYLEELPLHHHLRFAEGREFLRTAIVEIVGKSLPEKLAHECACGKEGCRKAMKTWWQTQFTKGAITDQLFTDPLYALKQMKATAVQLRRKHPDQLQMGIACIDKVILSLAACRKYIWEEIPYFFDIKPREKGQIYGYDQYLEGI